MARYTAELIARGARGDGRPERRPAGGEERVGLAAGRECVHVGNRQLQALRAQLAESEARRRALEQRLAALESSRPLSNLARSLSSTELRVAELVAAGRSNHEVASALQFSPKTVEWNLSKVYRKLHVRSRTEMAAKSRGRDAGNSPERPGLSPGIPLDRACQVAGMATTSERLQRLEQRVRRLEQEQFPPAQRLSGSLTAREARVAALAAAGATNQEIARALSLSAKTVEWNLSRIYRKLGVRSRTELAARAATDAAPGVLPGPETGER